MVVGDFEGRGKEIVMDRKKITVDSEVLEKLGICAALVYWHIEKWCLSNERLGKNYHDGRYWMFDTEKAIADGIRMKFASYRSVRRALDELCRHGYIVRGNYNTARRNRTWWYSISHLSNLDNCQTSICPDRPSESVQIGQMQVANLDNSMGQHIDLTTRARVNAPAHAHEESANLADSDWRSDLAASIASNAQRESEALALLDEAERSARTDPDHPYPESTLAYCAAQRESVRRTRRLYDAMDRVDYGLEDPAVDCAPLYDETFFDEDGNPYRYGDLTGWYADVERDLLFRVTEFYVERCWADGMEPTAADFASRETQQLIADCLAHHLAWLDDYYSDGEDAENDPETED